jgi:hypothetical protein
MAATMMDCSQQDANLRTSAGDRRSNLTVDARLTSLGKSRRLDLLAKEARQPGFGVSAVVQMVP